MWRTWRCGAREFGTAWLAEAAWVADGRVIGSVAGSGEGSKRQKRPRRGPVWVRFVSAVRRMANVEPARLCFVALREDACLPAARLPRIAPAVVDSTPEL